MLILSRSALFASARSVVSSPISLSRGSPPSPSAPPSADVVADRVPPAPVVPRAAVFSAAAARAQAFASRSFFCSSSVLLFPASAKIAEFRDLSSFAMCSGRRARGGRSLRSPSAPAGASNLE